MSSTLIKSRTSLQKAISGESEAITKYTAYSNKAMQEGFPNIAYLFKALVQAEQFHNRNHRNALKLVSEEEFFPPIPEIQVGSTLENVLDAIHGEHYEAKKMYPDFIKEIRSELKEEDAQVTRLSFSWAEQVELGHEKALKIALDVLEKGIDLDVEAIYVCRVCGNLVFNEPEDFCDVCGHDERFYMKIKRDGGAA
ncbi:MAG: rubrerythrin family protein [Promethearchaeota archaeon]